jgi:catechol 2,3-dioxygenase-like lactoylglutathione lyase family enzyme
MAARKKKVTKKAAKRRVPRPAAKRKKPAVRPKRREPESLRLRETVVSLVVNDLARSLAWYRDVLGWTVTGEWRDDKGKLNGVEMIAGEVGLYLSQDDGKKGWDRRKGEGMRIFWRTAQSVDRIAERIKKAGGVLDHEPMDEPWGERDFGITDPDGFRITISNVP